MCCRKELSKEEDKVTSRRGQRGEGEDTTPLVPPSNLIQTTNKQSFKIYKIMNLKQNIGADELEPLRSQLGISEEDSKNLSCTPTAPIEEGDRFTLTGVSKVRETAENGFLPLVFTTSNGKLIGTKHFGNATFPKGTSGVRPIGRTVDDALCYLLWAEKNTLEFEVESVKKLPERTIKDASGADTSYRPKQFDLSVRLPAGDSKKESK